MKCLRWLPQGDTFWVALTIGVFAGLILGGGH